MLYTIGHRHVLVPAPVTRMFRRQMVMRVRAETHASQHLSQPPSPPFKPDRTLTTLMSQFVTQIGDWWMPPKGDVIADEDVLTVDELTDQLRKEMENASETDNGVDEADAKLEKESRPNIWKFLKHVPLEEIQNSRIMASLANATYYIPRIQVLGRTASLNKEGVGGVCAQFKSVLERYGLHLVTTSVMCKQSATSAELVDEAVHAGDGMAVGKTETPKHDEGTTTESEIQESNIVSAKALHSGRVVAVLDKHAGWRGPFNVRSAAGSVYSQTLAQLARQVTAAAAVSHSAVTDTMARALTLLQVAMRPKYEKKANNAEISEERPGAVPVTVMNKCPTEWFVCDDEAKDTRLFCIQGSDNFESWQTNLQFDPVPFEDGTLGARVHRGVYEAARGLYPLFVPLVRDHIKSGKGKKICFTGHSLGGGIASVLLMMMVHRGDLKPEHVGRVFTFGGAASLCDSMECSTCSLQPICKGDHETHCKSKKTLLERLGLPVDTVVNVVMHKDIVPRAFACDYALVTHLLRTWSSSFKQHHCLTPTGRSTLYSFVGEIYVLQPPEDCHYVSNEGYHPLLPPEPALFKLTDPDSESLKIKEQMMARSLDSDELIGIEVEDKKAAFMALMDNPHPLETLADASSYGHKGAMSRYHNPLNYSRGLHSIVGIKKKEA